MDWLPELQKETTPTSESRDLPSVIQRAGDAGERAWEDFFSGVIADDLTRVAYNRAVRRFLEWPRISGKNLHEITAADVGDYLRSLSGSLPKKKQHHSALRRFFTPDGGTASVHHQPGVGCSERQGRIECSCDV